MKANADAAAVSDAADPSVASTFAALEADAPGAIPFDAELAADAVLALRKKEKKASETADLAQALKDGFDPNEILDDDHPMGTPGGWSALMTASLNGNVEIVKLLVNAGAQCDYTEPSEGFSAIYLAAEENHLEIAEVLLGVGGKALANIRSKDGRTAMFAAAQCDHPDMIRLLHRCGGDVELSSRNGVMPMWVGSQMGATGAVTALLELGARCDRVRPNPSDRTARDEIEAEQMEIERTARERLEKRARIEAIVADAKRAR